MANFTLEPKNTEALQIFTRPDSRVWNDFQVNWDDGTTRWDSLPTSYVNENKNITSLYLETKL